MQTFDEVARDITPKVPWNKGKLLGAKPPLRQSKSGQSAQNCRSSIGCAILRCLIWRSTAKLRGCDLVNLKVEDVAPHGFALERATVRQRKTGHPVKFELTEQTREAI
jgi:hypothetical protein